MDRNGPAGSMFSGSNLIASGGTYNVHNSSVYNVEKGTEQQFCFDEAERILGEAGKYNERLLRNVAPNALHGSMFSGSNLIVSGGNYNVHKSSVYNVEKGKEHQLSFHEAERMLGEPGKYHKRLPKLVPADVFQNSRNIFRPQRCHPDTRVAVIQEIMDWLAGLHEDTHTKGVAWLTGDGGAGKTAIGKTVCERCVEEGTLLASFFFGSNDATRNHSIALVATIAYQICTIDASIGKAVCDIIDNDPHIFRKSLRAQFMSLVVEPLRSSYASGLLTIRRLIVIDGLDECKDKSRQRDILETIAYLIKTYPQIPIRFLICSRPEPNIKNVIHGANMYSKVFTISLRNDYAASEAIKLYLCDSFNTIRQGHIFKHLIPDSWPSEGDLSLLIYRSSGQLIYASTVIKDIQSADDMPHQRLAVILGLRAPHGDLPFAQLDTLYTNILTMTKDPPKATKILAFIARYPGTCIPLIARYLVLDDEVVEIMLSKLAAIVGSVRNGDHDIYDHFSLLHKSFEDFLSDQSRSKELYVRFPDAVASDILRSIQIFSGTLFPTECPPFLSIGAYVRLVFIEPSDDCRFNSDLLNFPYLPFSPDDNVSKRKDWVSTSTKPLRVDVKDAVSKFPMESFCSELFSRHRYRCAEYQFTHYFFTIIFQLVGLVSL